MARLIATILAAGVALTSHAVEARDEQQIERAMAQCRLEGLKAGFVTYYPDGGGFVGFCMEASIYEIDFTLPDCMDNSSMQLLYLPQCYRERDLTREEVK